MPTAQRFAHIDSLRALAALLVLWMHSSGNLWMFSAPSMQHKLFDIAYLLDFGRLGVVLFFAISGFVIPSSLSGNKADKCWRFVIKRLFRLYPLYWLSIPIGVVTWW